MDIKKQQKNFAKHILYFVKNHKAFFPPDGKQKILIEKLRNEVMRSSIQKVYKEDEIKNEWQNFVDNLRYHILNDDPRKFLQWKEISYTMVFGGSKYELFSLKNNWPYWRKIIKDSYFGMPPLSKYCWRSSGSYTHSAYHFQKLLTEFDIKLDKFKTIMEFGGGYGVMALLAYRQGFNGSYLIYDLPEFLALQKYYLSSINETNFLLSDNIRNNVNTVSFFSKKEKLMDSLKRAQNIDLFIAMWSISESPLKLRENLFEKIFNTAKIKYVLIGFQKKFGDIDNCTYFKTFINKYNNYSWKIEEISHLKDNYYLLGKNNKYDNH